MDPGYRRLRYCRYADDEILGFTGPKAEAEQIKDRLAAFLRDELALELSAEKTLITHARTRAARFLGYEITVQHADSKITGGRRMLNGTVALRVPLDVIKAKRVPYRRRGKPWHRARLLNLDDYDIVRIYGAEYRGVIKMAAAIPHALRTLIHATATDRRTGNRSAEERDRRPPQKPTSQGADLPAPQTQVRTVRARHVVAVHQVARLARLGAPGPGQPGSASPATRSSTPTLSARRNRWRAQCAERRPLGSEGGCAEKAQVQDS